MSAIFFFYKTLADNLISRRCELSGEDISDSRRWSHKYVLSVLYLYISWSSFPEKLDAHKSARKIAVNAHLKAKEEHFQAHGAHIGAAVQHASYAKGLPEYHERTHRGATEKHREMAQEHLKHADLHRSVAQRHGITGGAHSEPFATITKSTHEGERSFKNARISHQWAALVNSFMPVAYEH